jgi:hypothetical protein
MGPVWTMAAVLTGIGLLALLHFMAAGLRNVTHLHDMRVKVGSLRQERAERLRTKAEGEIVEVDEAPAKKAA